MDAGRLTWDVMTLSPRADYSDMSGVRQLMKTPGGPLPKSPMNDLTNIAGEGVAVFWII